MIRINSVLVADDIEQECLDILKSNNIEAISKTKQSEEQLMTELPKYDAVIVRSATKITRKLIEAAAGKLKLIGRAGTGVDNIDVAAASERGIVVMNTPAGNSRSAAELTCTLILSLARHVAQADASMKNGKWDRKKFMGEELYGKTLAIIGLGRIGMEVAQRMQAFGMSTIGYDPYTGAEAAAKKGIEWLKLEDIWPRADYITVHVPLVRATENLISTNTLKQCKKGVKIINVARGGIVNERDLVESLNAGHAGGAAIDVFLEEPPLYREIVEHPKVICTPHLGASTIEAQQRVAQEVAENIVAINAGDGYPGALNASTIEAVSNKEEALLVSAAECLAKFAAVLSNSPKKLAVKYPINETLKETGKIGKALRAAAAVGTLNAKGVPHVNLINAELNAKKEGLQISVESSSDDILTIIAGEISVGGFGTQQGTFITKINGSELPVALPAVGTIAVTLSTKPNSSVASEVVKAKHTVPFDGGRVNLFSFLGPDEVDAISRDFSVVQFS